MFGGGHDSGKLNDQLLVAEPRHRCGLIGQTRGDEIGVVRTLVYRPTTEVDVTSTLPDRSNKLRKTVFAGEWLYSLPMRWAIIRYSELAASVSCMSKSTFIPTMLESASIWKSNLSRTLKTMERYGFVQLSHGARGSVIPRVPYQKISLTLPLSKSGLQGIQSPGCVPNPLLR